MRHKKDRVVIIGPARKNANNGNWQTAARWARFLRHDYDVSVGTDWPAEDEAHSPACMIALHARRSAAAVARFAAACPKAPLVLVLTGTDLYRDIQSDESARRSLDLATRLVVLQEEALNELAPAHRVKSRVIYQSAPTLKPGQSNQRSFDVVLVGHLRAEKDPLTPMRALEFLAPDSLVRLIHIGKALDDEYLAAAKAWQARQWPTLQRYVWMGERPHGETRQRIRHARAMVISSLMEGGANVIVEAVSAGVPVLASCISGNVGMLGRDYEGYFGVGDCKKLASLLDKTSTDPHFLQRLRQQCAVRAPLFAPERERAEVIELVRELLHDAPHGAGEPT